MNEEKPKLTLIASNSKSEATAIERAHEHEQLVYAHMCGIDAKPEWCVWGNNGKGGKEVLFWIRPSEEDEWVARKIAKYINDHNTVAAASVEMTEWNPDLSGNPVYQHTLPDDSKRIEWNTESK